MVVDAGGTTTHAESLEELTKAQEAHSEIAAKYGADSPMAQALWGQVENLQKQHTPLRITKNVVSINAQILRLQKDMEKHSTELQKIKTDVQGQIEQHQKAIQDLQNTLVSETKACEDALKADQGILDRLQAEVAALNKVRTPTQGVTPPQVPPQATPVAQPITPAVIHQLLEAISNAGLLNPSVAQNQQAALAQVEAAFVGKLQADQQQLQQQQQHLQQQQQQQQLQDAAAAAASASQSSQGSPPKLPRTGTGQEGDDI